MNKSKLLLSVLVLLLSFSPALLRAQEEIQGVYIEEEEEIDESMFMVVEDQPGFPGGDAARMRFLAKKIKYPAEAVGNCEQGTVFVSFVVEKDGRITNVKILRGISPSIDAETIRVVRMMPDWKPGKQDGEAVRVRFTMPVKFTLAGNCTKNEDMLYKSAKALYKKRKYKECKKKLEELGRDYPHHQKGLELMKKVLKKLNKAG